MPVSTLWAMVAFALSACGPKPMEENAPPIASAVTVDSQTSQRIADLVIVNGALQQYHAAHGSYPVSDNAQGYASSWGASLGSNWIPELGITLPRDPGMSEAGNEAQYLYISDGSNYKLIAHATGDCSSAVETSGIRIDPIRTGATECWGYGFWSAGGEAL
jgi:hypothetical protein